MNTCSSSRSTSGSDAAPADALLASGFQVVVLDDFSTGHVDTIPNAASFRTGSYGDTTRVENLLHTARIGAVVHCGAKSIVAESTEQPELYFNVNVQASLNLLDAVRAAAAGLRALASVLAPGGGIGLMVYAPHGRTGVYMLQDALRLLADNGDACVLAGGQSLMPMLNFRLLAPAHVIDLNRVPALAGIRVEQNVLHVGAMTRQGDLETSSVVRDAAPLLQAAVRQVGHRQTRNRGTLGGSLCHLDPAAELVTAAMAMDATLIAESAGGGTRRIPIAAWSAGYLTNALRPGEMLTAIEFPLWRGAQGHGFVEFARRKGDFAIIGVATLLWFLGRAAPSRLSPWVVMPSQRKPPCAAHWGEIDHSSCT